MTRYKGRASAKTALRDFPHVDENVVPLGGFGTRPQRHARLSRQREIAAPILPGRGEGEPDYILSRTERWASVGRASMSALGHKRTFSDANVTPALVLESDIKCVNMECPPVATSRHLSALALTL